jgi:hypothetical protein
MLPLLLLAFLLAPAARLDAQSRRGDAIEQEN